MFYLRVLGGLELTAEQGTLPPAATQRRRLALLAVLAVAGEHGMPRERVVGFLWPESTARHARHALEQLLYRVRRDLGVDAVKAEAGSLRLDPRVLDSDLRRFRSALQERRGAHAVELYAGPLLEGVDLGGAPEMEQWLELESSRLRREFLRLLSELGDAARARGARAEAVEWRRRAVDADALSTRAVLSLMESLAEAGDHAGAIVQARCHARRLRSVLDVEPDPSVVALEAQLRAAAGAGGIPPARANVTVPPQLSYKAPPTDAVRHRPPPRTGRAWWIAAAAGVALVLLTGLVVRDTSRDSGRLPAAASVAVLPLRDGSPNPGDAYIADGVTDELIHDLSRVPGLRVVARSSSSAFRGREVDVRALGDRLGVASVLEGSVRREGDRVRITVQLVSTATGYTRWSESYDRRLEDVFALQQEVARAVTRRLAPQADFPGREAASADPGVARGYQLYLRARYLWNRDGDPAVPRAVALFEEALRADPASARAFAGLSEAFAVLAERSGAQPRQAELLARSERAAREALRLDPDLAEAHVSLAHLLVNRWQWREAEAELRSAIEANPSSAAAFRLQGDLLALEGRFDEAVTSIRQAQALDPISPSTRGKAAYVLNLARRYPEAEREARDLLALDAADDEPYFRLGSVLAAEGRFGEAEDQLRLALRASPTGRLRALPMLGYTLARAGQPDRALRLRPAIEQGLRDRSVSPYFAAAYFGASGDTARAFQLLDALAVRRESCLRDLAVDPVMDGLRADPRFRRTLGLLRGREGVAAASAPPYTGAPRSDRVSSMDR